MTSVFDCFIIIIKKNIVNGVLILRDLKQIRLYLLDMDGTIYLDDQLFEGVIPFLEHIKAVGGRYLFLTNNSSKSVDKYIQKLASLGISTTAEDFFTSVDATVHYLKGKTYQKIYAFGTASFKEQLAKSGLPITDRREEGVDCLCMGFDTELTFQKLEDACILLGQGVEYVATNPDWVCPTWYGFVPDCGSVSEMLYNATKRRPLFIGKPKPEIALLAMEKTGFSPEQTAIIGDRLYTDIACGNNAGITSIFVLSGEGTMENVAAGEAKPDYIFPDINALYNEIR